jgi:glycosyltransferase involved in cell wall biosynthesis
MAPGLISLIVSTYNRPDALRAVLLACFAQTDRRFEIIIVDDGSGEDTRECIDKLRAAAPVPVRHVWQPDEGFRLAMARNRGILQARGDYILLLDGDCIPQRDHVARHRRLAQPGTMVTGSRILLDSAYTERVLAQGIDLQRLAPLEALALRACGSLNKCAPLLFTLPDLGRLYRRFSYRRIKGCNLAAWRRDLERINGFDESFLGWGHEDADLVLRMHHAGVRRKDGAYATEVLHLWHPEAQRAGASSNKALVRERERLGTIEAAQGLRQHAAA